MIDIRTAEGLRKVNSMTQYPSIPTYHALGERGRLTEDRQVLFTQHLDVTEKIDGTNARIILPPLDGEWPSWLIGSRSELLAAEGDLVVNPALSIVETVRGHADHIAAASWSEDHQAWRVIFGEVYGHGIGRAAREYTGLDLTGFRVFDMVSIDSAVLDWPIEKIAATREARAPEWVWAHHDELLEQATMNWQTGLVPLLTVVGDPAQMPVSVADTEQWLRKVASERSRAALDETGRGGMEGVIVRTADRSQIAKIRFEDYERTLRVRS